VCEPVVKEVRRKCVKEENFMTTNVISDEENSSGPYALL